MRQFLAVVAFSLLAIGLFAGYSNFGIPQIEPAPPPVEEQLDLSSMNMDQFIALGERIFNGKGTCTLCHNSLGRAPMLGTVADVVAERLQDERYQGEATNIEQYLIESLVEPSAFVVVGFGKKGSKDSESPMPNISAGSIGLSEAEIAAVVAFIQDDSGAEVTVEIPTGLGDADEADAQDGEPREAIGDPQELIALFTCDACHAITGEGGDLGPNLSKIGAQRDRAYLRQALLDPNAVIADGFEPDAMPYDLGEQMYAIELETLLDFLGGLK